MSRSMREDLDAAMSGTVLGAQRREAIRKAAEEEGGKPVKKVVRPMVVLAAVLCALIVSAFALSPTLRELVESALGGIAPYSQEVEGACVTDQGIEITVLSALSDATTTKVYVSVQDKTGNRLAEGVDLGFRISRPETEGSGGMFGKKLLHYNAENGTALFEFISGGSEITTEGGDLILKIDSVQPGYHVADEVPLPMELATRALLETQRLSTGETVLKPGQTNYAFPGVDYMALSSMGFTSDGWFRILVRLDDQADMENSYLLTTPYSKSEDEAAGAGYMSDFVDCGFTLDGGNYYEFRFPAKPVQLEDIETYGLYGQVVTQPAIAGNWTLRVKLEQLETRTYEIEETIGKLTEHVMVLSPLSVILRGDTGVEGQSILLNSYPVTAILKDGSVVRSKNSGSMWGFTDGPYRSLDRWEFETPLDLDQVAGIAVDQWMIPVNGDTAGPGYWLKERP